MDFVKAIVLQLISPLNLSLIALLISCAFGHFKKEKTAKALRYFALFWILLCSQPYFSDLLLYPLENHEEQNNINDKKPDVIFVLACYYSTQGNVSEISRWSECSLQRNIEAARLHFETGSPILITGGNFLYNKDTNYTKQTIEFFKSLNIEADSLIGTYKGSTTHQEIESASEYLSGSDVWIVSSATHITRLKELLSSKVNTIRFFPVDFHGKTQLTPYLSMPSLQALENTRIALYEYVSILKFRLIRQ